jgi:hypothetical protein
LRLGHSSRKCRRRRRSRYLRRRHCSRCRLHRGCPCGRRLLGTGFDGGSAWSPADCAPLRPRRGLRPPLGGAGYGWNVRDAHDRSTAAALRAEGQGGVRSQAKSDDRAVEAYGRSGCGEDEPHLTTGFVGCGPHPPLIGVGRAAYDPLTSDRQRTAATMSADRLAKSARNSARSAFSRTTCWLYSSMRPVRS